MLLSLRTAQVNPFDAIRMTADLPEGDISAKSARAAVILKAANGPTCTQINSFEIVAHLCRRGADRHRGADAQLPVVILAKAHNAVVVA